MSFASALCRTPLVASPTPRRASRHAGRRAVAPRAFAAPQQLWQLAEAAAAAKPGEVDAPISAIIIGAVVVTALSFAVSFGLKGGTDASIQMQERDRKKFNKYDK
ncbi:Small-conductance mechanosensitive ion channel [Micractinium conductrix]|uniref:Small-conductance mechanosensitive ion channel n=1 Tax=Micractinium conductrix TaxID=554055 RepID=A0A2P6VN33_9CHLO|nr:Small-conductance mechanosensitive ion channel [Micractinium conductrix]|eukprot:PSC75504.1 Small-conductance mechanosensitive ion channel [Micractinium conductrix]